MNRCLMILGLLSSHCAAMSAAAEIDVALELTPSDANPRNSEGDFIQLNDGQVLFVYTRFTSGGGDHDKADLVSRFSKDSGQTWSPEDSMVVPNEGDWNVMSVSLLRLADHRIALFYLQKNSLTDCRPVVRFSSDEARSWSKPKQIIPDEQVGYYVMNNDRVVQLSSGRLIAPVALHNRPGQKNPDWDGEIACYLSDDGGDTWRRSTTMQKAFDDSGRRVTAQEPGVVELKDGRLMLWIRTKSGEQFRSFSSDEGDRWSEFEPMGVLSPNSPATIERIPSSGDLLLVWNDHAHLEPSQRKLRTPYTIALSRDDGVTWRNEKNLFSDPNGWYCYTAIEFVDGHVLLGHCAGDRRKGGLNRSQITRFPVDLLYQ